MYKPNIVQQLTSIGFKEIIGEWKPVWGQGDGEYWYGVLTRDDDVVIIDRHLCTLNKIEKTSEFLMSLT